MKIIFTTVLLLATFLSTLLSAQIKDIPSDFLLEKKHAWHPYVKAGGISKVNVPAVGIGMQFHSIKTHHGFDCSLTAGHLPSRYYPKVGTTHLSATILYQYWPNFIQGLYLGAGGGISNVCNNDVRYLPREDILIREWDTLPFLSQCIGYEFNKKDKGATPFVQLEINEVVMPVLFTNTLIHPPSANMYCGIRF